MQPETLFSQMCATDIWATDACKVWGKSRMRATYIPDARNPSNHANCERVLTLFALGCDFRRQVPLACQRYRTSVVFQRHVGGRMSATTRVQGLHLALTITRCRFAFRPTRCSPLRQSHYCCYPARPRRPGKRVLVVRKCARGG